MDLNLKGRLALVTGASKGIGYACAARLAEEGCELHLVSRTAADLQSAAQRLSQLGNGRVSWSALDLSKSDETRTLVSEVPGADILVNNAGAIPRGAIDQLDEATWREAWELKVFGYINLCRAYNSAMKERGNGVIINIIGAAGERPAADYAAGSAGNAGLMALTRAMGAISGSYGVRIVGVNPGYIETERFDKAVRALALKTFGDENRWRELLDPDYPPGKPEHIADMVAFLASDRSAYTTGTIITVDGGRCAR